MFILETLKFLYITDFDGIYMCIVVESVEEDDGHHPKSSRTTHFLNDRCGIEATGGPFADFVGPESILEFVGFEELGLVEVSPPFEFSVPAFVGTPCSLLTNTSLSPAIPCVRLSNRTTKT